MRFISRDKLLELYTSQVTDKDIAEIYGVYPSTVTRTRQKYGIPTHPITDSTRSKMSSENKGHHRHTEYQIQRIKELSSIRRGIKYIWNEDDIDRLCRMYSEEGFTIKNIADVFKVSKITIHRVMKENKIIIRFGGTRGYTIDKKKREERQSCFPEILELYQRGHAIADISKVVKHGFEYVRQCLLENNIHLRECGETRQLQYKNNIRQAPKRPIGSNHPAWRGGKFMRGKYFVVYDPKHCALYSHKGKYVAEHIFVWERYYDRMLQKGWIIHHLNGICIDNRIENLEAMPSHKHCYVLQSMGRRVQELEKQLLEAK